MKGKLTTTQTLKATQAIAGGGSGGPTTWDKVKNKPFSTVDTTGGLTIYDDTLGIDTLDTIATIDYVDTQVDGITTTLTEDYALKSEIPTVPTNVSAFNNDAGYITDSALSGYATEQYVDDAVASIDLSDYATKSELNAVEAEIPSLTGYATESYVDTAISNIPDPDWSDIQNKPSFATVATSGDYDDLLDKPTIPSIDGLATEQYVDDAIAAIDIPEDVSELNNDAGYITDSEAQQTIAALPDGKSIRWNSNNQLETVIGGGYETYTFSESDLPSGGLSLDANVFAYYSGSVSKYLYYNSTDNSSLNAIFDKDWKEGEAIEVTVSGTAITTTTTTMYYHESPYSSYPSWKGFFIDNWKASGDLIQGLIYVEQVYSGSYVGAGLLSTSSAASSFTIDSISGSPEYKKKVSKDWVEPYFPLDDRIFAGTNNAVKIGTDGATSDKNSLTIGNIHQLLIDAGVSNLKATDYSLAIGNPLRYSNSRYSIVEAKNGSIAVGDPYNTASYIGGKVYAYSGSIAAGIGEVEAVTDSIAIGAGTYSTITRKPHKAQSRSIVVGTDCSALKTNSSAFGNGLTTTVKEQHVQGRFNYYQDNDTTFADIIGNGTSATARSNAEATDWSGNKYLAGDIYTNVTNWSDPRNNSIKLANIPAPPTTADGTYTLQAVVSNGTITYSWV